MAMGLTGGGTAGMKAPEGSAAVGWRVGVYWRDDQKFYMGEIAAYNDEDDEYEMNYDDSELLTALPVRRSPPSSPFSDPPISFLSLSLLLTLAVALHETRSCVISIMIIAWLLQHV